ncbi:ATP-binding protein [Methanomethylovorans sp.]|uniref:ATP-binding protein n=1 Tax=Methanomethylovorans sp. TaxID=2758717 RepID=UPI003D106EC9
MVIFFDRVRELSQLEEMYSAPSSSLVVFYGRRRVGKTELSKEFVRNKKSLYLFVEIKSEELLLRDLEIELETITGIRPRLDSFDDFFTVLFNIKDKLVVVLDEFQNFARVDPRFFSKFQKHWDAHHRESKHMIIVIGSFVGMMKKIFEESKEPLFGRATYLFNIKPFTFADSYAFLNGIKHFQLEEAMKTYFMLGGIPKYLLLAGQFSEPHAMQVFKKLFVDTQMLMEEAKNILVLEFGSEHKGYFSILEAIASGKVIPAHIADYTAMPPGTVAKYLNELVHKYEIVKKEEPVVQGGSRNSRYFLHDNFFRFWFKFIYKYYGTFEIDPDLAEIIVKKDINTYFGYAFEDVAKELLISLNKQEELPFRFTHIGKWWKKDTEIDLIAFDKTSRNALFCEVKWKYLSEKEAWGIVADLKEKSKKVSGTWNENYCLIAKKIEGKENMDCFVFDMEDVEHMMDVKINSADCGGVLF